MWDLSCSWVVGPCASFAFPAPGHARIGRDTHARSTQRRRASPLGGGAGCRGFHALPAGKEVGRVDLRFDLLEPRVLLRRPVLAGEADVVGVRLGTDVPHKAATMRRERGRGWGGRRERGQESASWLEQQEARRASDDDAMRAACRRRSAKALRRPHRGGSNTRAHNARHTLCAEVQTRAHTTRATHTHGAPLSFDVNPQRTGCTRLVEVLPIGALERMHRGRRAPHPRGLVSVQRRAQPVRRDLVRCGRTSRGACDHDGGKHRHPERQLLDVRNRRVRARRARCRGETSRSTSASRKRGETAVVPPSYRAAPPRCTRNL